MQCPNCNGACSEIDGEPCDTCEGTGKVEDPLLYLGGTYETQSGDTVRMVKINNAGTPYETLEDEQGVNRYSRRISDMGRVTGSAHDYSDPKNIKEPFHAQQLDEIKQPHDNWPGIVKEYESRIGRKYKCNWGPEGSGAYTYTFFGLVHADDDYYYGMVDNKTGKMRLLSCVGAIDGFGFEEIPQT
jgi:hypothetical protein